MRVNEITLDENLEATPVAETEPTVTATALEPSPSSVIIAEEPDDALSLGEVGLMVSDLQQGDDESTALDEGIAVLEAYKAKVEKLIAQKTFSLESLQLLQMGVAPYLLTKPIQRISTEGEGWSLEYEHTVVLESIKHSLKSMIHSQGLVHSNGMDAFLMLFRSSETTIAEYSKRLQTAEKKFKNMQAAGGAHEDLHLDLHVLDNFYAQLWHNVKNIQTHLRRDLAMSEYVLTVYPQKVLKVLDQVIEYMRTEKTLDGLISKVVKLPTAVELFDKRFLTDENGVYFGGAQLKVKGRSLLGKLIMGREEGNVPNKRLAEMSTWEHVQELMHPIHARHISSTSLPVGYIVSGLFSETMKVGDADVAAVLKSGESYLAYAKEYLKVLKIADTHYDTLWKLYENFEVEGMNHNNTVINDLFRYVDCLQSATLYPSSQELHRALKGARYAGHLVNRLSYVNRA